ncbi:LptF/LptG family permease [bacterium]|nr:LptF/LptG family permease [bacterium]
MRLLDRYLLRELLLPLIIVLSGFLLLWLVFDIVGVMDDFQQNHLLLPDVIEYYLYKTPRIMSEGLVPVALLISTLYALTQHARHNELTAIRTAGISLWRVLVPYVFVGVLFSLGLFWLNEFGMPDANLRMEEVLNRYQASAENATGNVVRNFNFYNERDRRKWTIGEFDRTAGAMTNVLVEWARSGGRVEYLKADSAHWAGDEWVFHKALTRTFDPANKDQFDFSPAADELAVKDFKETPREIWSEFSISQLSTRTAAKRAVVALSTLKNYFDLHPELSREKRAILMTQFHGRIAMPWTCLVVMLIAIPFAAPSGRRNVFAGVTAGLAITFAFFVLQRLCLALGTGGYITPWLAAWLPNLFFAALGIYLTSRVR